MKSSSLTANIAPTANKLMIVSTKGRYALRVMVRLALSRADGYIPLKEIAEAESICQK